MATSTGSAYAKGVLDLTFLDIKEEADLERALTERSHLILNKGGMTNSSFNFTMHANNNGSGGNNNSGNHNTHMAEPSSPTAASPGGEPALGNTSGSPNSSPTRRRRGESGEEIKAIRLANNLIENLNILYGPMSRALDCSSVQWIDISFNAIKNIPDSFIALFPNVTTVYCHANQVAKLSVAKKFAGFPALKSLSLYGNPVEEHKVMKPCSNAHLCLWSF
jgi:hypothetical protein